MPRLITDAPDPYARLFTFPKWNVRVTVLQEHRLMRQLPEFAGWSRDKHAQIAGEYLTQYVADRAVVTATIQHAARAYGDHGPLIAGGLRDHWPTQTKDVIRACWTRNTFLADASLAHWQAAGKRAETWRAQRDALQAHS